MWVDPNQEGENQELVEKLIKRCFTKNIKIILKSSSITAWAYIYSEFFRISINICKKFKIITNKSRIDDMDNEDLPYFNKMKEINENPNKKGQ